MRGALAAGARVLPGPALADGAAGAGGLLTAPAGRQTRGFATCPASKVPLGGGVFVVSGSTAANVNSSFPLNNRWVGDVNNASGLDTTFVVSAVCAKQPKLYSVVQSAGVDNLAGRQDSDSVTCPAGSLPLGGGATSNSFDLAVNMNTTVPDGPSWHVEVNNASATDTSFSTFAVCGKLENYTIANGGGVFSNSGNVLVNINSTALHGTDSWDAFENNASDFDAGLVPIVI